MSAPRRSRSRPRPRPARYFIVAKADGPGALVETLEGNNTRAAAIAIGPDLAVTAMSAPATGGAGLPLTVTDTVTNQAGGAAASSTLRFYLSTNTTFGAGDVLLGSRLVPSLAPGVNSPGSTSLTIPPGTAAGMYYIVAVADAAGEVAEINEANNTRAVVVKVMPDLVVVALAAPASASAGATISVTDTTKNQGEGTAAATTTRFYLSTNASYDLGDVSLNSRAVPSLATAAGEHRHHRPHDSRRDSSGSLLPRGAGGRGRRRGGNQRDQQHACPDITIVP